MTDSIKIDARVERALAPLTAERGRPVAIEGWIICMCGCQCGHAAASHRSLVNGTRECRYCPCNEHRADPHESTCWWPTARSV